MSFKNYTLIKILVVVAVATVIGWAVTSGYPFLPLPVAIVGAVILLLFRRRVKDVVTDERIFTVAGKASLLTYRVFAMLAALAGATLVAVSKGEESLVFYVGLTLSYATAAIVFLYYIFYNYYNRKLGGKYE